MQGFSIRIKKTVLAARMMRSDDPYKNRGNYYAIYEHNYDAALKDYRALIQILDRMYRNKSTIKSTAAGLS